MAAKQALEIRLVTVATCLDLQLSDTLSAADSDVAGPKLLAIAHMKMHCLGFSDRDLREERVRFLSSDNTMV